MIDETRKLEETALESVLIEQYRALQAKLPIVQVSNRLMCLVAIGFVAIVEEPSLIQAAAPVSVVALIAYIWSSELRLLNLQIEGLEETLARRTGGDWESAYIESRYFTSVTERARDRLRVEPVVWFVLTIVLAVSQLILSSR